MKRHLNRWTVAVGWTIVMGIVWVLFVPNVLSVTMFALLTLAGLFALIFGSAIVSDSRAPRSINAILSEMEADDRTVRPRANR